MICLGLSLRAVLCVGGGGSRDCHVVHCGVGGTVGSVNMRVCGLRIYRPEGCISSRGLEGGWRGGFRGFF